MTGLLSIATIQEVVAQHFGLPLPALLGNARRRGIVRPRHIAMLVASERTRHSVTEIARHFGDRDRTSVVHALDSIKAHLERDGWLAEQLATIHGRLDKLEDVPDTPQEAAALLSASIMHLRKRLLRVCRRDPGRVLAAFHAILHDEPAEAPEPAE